MISEKQYGYTDPEWRDLLTSYDGQSITYDQIGNPLSYRDSMSFTWTDGRRMSTASAGGHTLSFEYNGDGIRTAKTADGVKHVYITGDNRLLQETWGSNKIEYLYDDTGTIFSLYYNGAKFYLIKNLQGDVVELRNSTNGLVARYTYDAYGKCTSVKDSSGAEITDASNIALINPIRYRGYYFDSETGLYYVNSRYYDPEIGRWINADNAIPSTSESVQGYNLFAYCFNNPVNMDDHSGHWPKWLKNVVKAVAVVAVVAAVAAVTVATAGAGTAAAVIAVGAAKGAAIGMASGAAIGAAMGAVNHRVSTGSWSGADTAALNGMGDGALSGAVTGAITGAAGSALKVSQAAKAWDSGTFKSGYQSMKYHYNKHVVSEGLTKGNNVLKYTQDAVGFANGNSSILKYTYNYNYGNASWNLTYSTGQGGMFTSAGKILTFWYR